jgi:carbamoylphosphate synthase large subunit
VATFADDTAVMAVGDSFEEATEKLQRAVDQVNNWTRKWLMKLK